MSYNAIKVANRLLQIATDNGATIDPLQMMKLVYISHGWSFPFFERPLLNEPVEAWQYGPVIRDLYGKVREFRSSPIIGPLDGDNDPRNTSEEDDRLLLEVYRVYGKLSGGQLSNLTHKDGTPWAIVWNKAGKNSVIPNGLISQHYHALAEKSSDQNTST